MLDVFDGSNAQLVPPQNVPSILAQEPKVCQPVTWLGIDCSVVLLLISLFLNPVPAFAGSDAHSDVNAVRAGWQPAPPSSSGSGLLLPLAPFTATSTVWLPLVIAEPSPLPGQPIWAVGETQGGTVALFRHHFTLSQTMSQAELLIIADTRYEVWFDGGRIGRGPARFSRARQEFDVFPLGTLAAGPHTVAILVQYAPNTRRSESLQPALQAGLRAVADSAWQTLIATSAEWKAMVSSAWDADARPISQLNLIGPMEVLDLRRLPVDWMEPGFDDSAWPAAQVISPSPFPALSERTIPLLRDTPHVPIAVIDSGVLSPGWRLIELEHPTDNGLPITYTLRVTATASMSLSLEALDSAPVSVDGGTPLAWQPLDDPRRPDALKAVQMLPIGPHTLYISVPPERTCPQHDLSIFARLWTRSGTPWSCTLSSGRTLAIRLDDLALAQDLDVTPTHDPGRRTLLANPSSGGPVAPQVQLLATGAEISIPYGDTPRYVVLDFGRTLHARLSMVADGPAGTIVDAGWDERLTAGRPLPNPGSLAANLWSQVDSWVLDGTPRSLTTLDTRAGRYLLLQVFGPGPVRLRRVHALEETYPISQTGYFASSDALLNMIWQVGVDTLVPNMTDAYTDTPWRERGQWWADAMISLHINRAAFGDLALFRRGLRQMADAIDAEGRPAPMAPNGGGSTILDFGMQWIEGLYLYGTLSGDLALIEELYPAAQRLVGFLASYEGPAGLLDVPPAHWSQSALIDWPAASSRSGESTALNAQYAAALRQMGELADALGDIKQAEVYLSRSARVQRALNDVLWVPEQGCYAASRVNGESVSPSLHAQAWALRYGIVPDERRESTLRALDQQISPFFDEAGWSVIEPLGMFAVLEAWRATNRTNEALELIRERYGDLLAQGAATWWELYTPNQDRSHSLSHAWGGSPTWFLSSHVLGGTLIGPERWHVAPHPGDLEYVQGAVPIGDSLLHIAWHRPRCGQFGLTVTAPPSSRGDVLLPVTRWDAQVMLDETIVWDNGPTGTQPVEMTDDGLLLTGLGSGKHTLAVSLTCETIFLPLVVR